MKSGAKSPGNLHTVYAQRSEVPFWEQSGRILWAFLGNSQGFSLNQPQVQEAA